MAIAQTSLTDASITEQTSLEDDDLFYFVRDPGGSPSDAKARERAILGHYVEQSSHGFSIGDVLRHDGSTFVAATADTTANARVLGIVDSVPNSDAFVFRSWGQITGLSGLTAGSIYYLQDAGGLGSSAGSVNVPLLIADSTTSGWFIPTGAAGGGATTLGALTDVDPTGATDGNILVYDSSSNDWLDGDTAPVANRLEQTVEVTASSGSNHAIDCSAGSMHQITLDADCTFSFSNVPSGGFDLLLELAQDGTGGRTVTWPASVTWPGGNATTLSNQANDVDLIRLLTLDGGTTWRAYEIGIDFS